MDVKGVEGAKGAKRGKEANEVQLRGLYSIEFYLQKLFEKG